MTQERSIVRDITVEFEGVEHKASYFVEHGIVHAHVGGRIVPTQLGERDAAELVRSLLLGHLQQTARKARLVSRWQGTGGDGSPDSG